jgi:hypothetical protein
MRDFEDGATYDEWAFAGNALCQQDESASRFTCHE